MKMVMQKGQHELWEFALHYFGEIYKDNGNCYLEAQLKTIKLFPSFFYSGEKKILGEEVTLKEIEDALKLFKIEKSLGPDG